MYFLLVGCVEDNQWRSPISRKSHCSFILLVSYVCLVCLFKYILPFLGVNGLLFEKMEMNGNRHPSPPPVNGKIHIPSHMMGNIVGMNGSTKRSFIDLNHTSVIDKKKIDDPYNLLGIIGYVFLG